MSETGTATKQWYVVHTYSGFENKVAAAIESRALPARGDGDDR